MILEAVYRNGKLLVLVQKEEEVQKIVEELRKFGLKVQVEAVSICG